MRHLLYIWKEGRFFARHCVWEKTQGSSKATKLYRHKNTAAVSAWIVHLDKIKTCQTFCQERSKRDTLVSNLIFLFNPCPLLTQHSLHSWPYQAEKSERAIYWKLILCLHEVWWSIAIPNVTSPTLENVTSLILEIS